MRDLPAALFILSANPVGHASPESAQAKTSTAPETFNARATVGSAQGQGDAYVTVKVDKYQPEKDLQVMQKALKDGGSAAFVTALRAAAVVGKLEVGDKTFNIRWARQVATGSGRTITFVVDSP